MTPMLERLAHRLAEWRGCEPWERLDDEVREYQAGIVRAALQELREPDEAMSLAGDLAQCSCIGCSCDCDTIFRAMIDAALGDSP